MASVAINCERRVETAAYLDGELDAPAIESYESHLKGCAACSTELSEQRRLLCALEFALGSNDSDVELPRDFARVVAANAESDMSGVRDRAEHRRALRLSIILSVITFILIGGAAFYDAISVPVSAGSRILTSVFGFVWTAIYDTGAGLAVIARAVGRHLFFDLHPISLIAILPFAIAIALLPRLISKYHRAEITE